MLTIQEVGNEILGNSPRSFYVFTGVEYGVKEKYLSILTKYYGSSKEAYSVKALLDMMATKHLIPLQPCLYIVRYDEEFLASLNDSMSNKIKSSKIIGTVVCIYDKSTKGSNKLEKYLSDFTVSIDTVNESFIRRYLHSDFPTLPDRLINLAANIGSDYGDSQKICKSMSVIPPEDLFALSDDKLTELFGKSSNSTETEIKRGIASRNFTHLIKLVDTYSGELDSLLYTILSTMIELDKIVSNKYVQSDLREFDRRWNHKDIFNMFMNTYSELKKLRSYATDSYASLVYLFGLLKFSEIPAVEEMI